MKNVFFFFFVNLLILAIFCYIWGPWAPQGGPWGTQGLVISSLLDKRRQFVLGLLYVFVGGCIYTYIYISIYLYIYIYIYIYIFSSIYIYIYMIDRKIRKS